MAQNRENKRDASEDSETDADEDLFTVEAILSEKWYNGDDPQEEHPAGTRWLVKWEGYGIKE
jgi:hypothetical protein